MQGIKTVETEKKCVSFSGRMRLVTYFERFGQSNLWCTDQNNTSSNKIFSTKLQFSNQILRKGTELAIMEKREFGCWTTSILIFFWKLRLIKIPMQLSKKFFLPKPSLEIRAVDWHFKKNPIYSSVGTWVWIWRFNKIRRIFRIVRRIRIRMKGSKSFFSINSSAKFLLFPLNSHWTKSSLQLPRNIISNVDMNQNW